MNLLVAAATDSEIAPFVAYLTSHWSRRPDGMYFNGNCTVTILVTGIGMHRMSYALGSTFAVSRPDLCINAGIAGAFPGKAEIGDVVHVTSEIIADLGADDADGSFLSPDQLGLEEDLKSNQDLVNTSAGQYQFLRAVKGISSNTSHGYQPTIDALVASHDPDIETMEGAAFFYACMKSNIPFIEIRAISNIVTSRDRSAWDIPLAINRLTLELQTIVQFFAGS